MEKQLNPCAATTEPVLQSLNAATIEAFLPLSPALDKRNHCSEKPAHSH